MSPAATQEGKLRKSACVTVESPLGGAAATAMGCESVSPELLNQIFNLLYVLSSWLIDSVILLIICTVTFTFESPKDDLIIINYTTEQFQRSECMALVSV